MTVSSAESYVPTPVCAKAAVVSGHIVTAHHRALVAHHDVAEHRGKSISACTLKAQPLTWKGSSYAGPTTGLRVSTPLCSGSPLCASSSGMRTFGGMSRHGRSGARHTILFPQRRSCQYAAWEWGFERRTTQP